MIFKKVGISERNYTSLAGVLRYNTSSKRVRSRHHGIQRYCVLCIKTGMTERKYTSYNAKYCTGVRTNRSIKDGMGGPTGSRTDAVKQYKKSKKMEEGVKISQESEQDDI